MKDSIMDRPGTFVLVGVAVLSGMALARIFDVQVPFLSGPGAGPVQLPAPAPVPPPSGPRPPPDQGGIEGDQAITSVTAGGGIAAFYVRGWPSLTQLAWWVNSPENVTVRSGLVRTDGMGLASGSFSTAGMAGSYTFVCVTQGRTQRMQTFEVSA